MPKHEKFSPKDISNRIKSKGLQKLRWYCQMCQKQCRDQNGFKCHLTSESHQRQLLLYAENPGKFMYDYSEEFERGYMDLLRRQFGTKRVRANQVYQEYIKDKQHIHMNSTRWYTLTGFIQYLGKAGICRIDHNERGWWLQYIDRAEEERKLKQLKKQKQDKDDEEKIQELIQKQADKALELAESEGKLLPETEYTELRKTEGEKVEFAFCLKKVDLDSGLGTRIPPEATTEKAKVAFGTVKKSEEKAGSSSKKITQKSSLEEIKEEEERRKERQNRRDYWLFEGIVVKIVTKKLSEKYYKKKAAILSVTDNYTAVVKLLTGNDELKLDQGHIETVIPAIGKLLLVVNGAYRGRKARLKSVEQDDYSVTVEIAEGVSKGRTVAHVKYEDVSKLHVE